ncbi:MAG: hypothetical protein A2177_09610 [Spirochaetes bacterium RBG_13_68_11]|nr:MAG: hypothetical protein A2177_09610 [Spirochaetes bacterium RBG_13_68_11]
MKRAVAVGFLLLAAAAFCWSLPVRFGFAVGSTLGMATGADWDAVKSSVQSYYESYGYSVSIRDGVGIAWNMGAFVETPVVGPLSLRLGLFYDEPSAVMRITNNLDSDDWARWIERYRLLEVPAVLRLRLGTQFSILGGGFGAWRFGDLREIIDGPSDDRSTSNVPDTGYADLLYGVTAGIEFKENTAGEAVFIDIQYIHVISPITDSDPPATNDFYLRGLMISIGVSTTAGK